MFQVVMTGAQSPIPDPQSLPKTLFVNLDLRSDEDPPIPLPPGEDPPPPVKEPPDTPVTEPDAPVREPGPAAPRRL